MKHPADFRFLEREELASLSLDEKLAYLDVFCADVINGSAPAKLPSRGEGSERLVDGGSHLGEEDLQIRV